MIEDGYYWAKWKGGEWEPIEITTVKQTGAVIVDTIQGRSCVYLRDFDYLVRLRPPSAIDIADDLIDVRSIILSNQKEA